MSQTDQEQAEDEAEIEGAAGLVPEDVDVPLVVRRAPRVRTVDFSQPTKFTVELRRRIVRVLGPFCEAFAIRLSSELRAPVELAVADSSQLTWAAAKAQLPAHAIAVALEVQSVEREMLLGIEPRLILQALECLLGGTAEQAPAERKLSEIDWALTRRLLESMTAQLNQAWRDLGGLQLALGEVDLEGDAGVIAPIGEPTFAVTLVGTIDGVPSTMSLLIPWSAIAPVADDIFSAGPKPEDADPQEGRAVRRGLAGAHVLLRAEVGSARMPVEQMLALTPGALLALEDRAENGVRLFAEGVPLGRASPGLRGTRRAIKLTAAMSPGVAPALLSAPSSKPSASAVEAIAADTGASDAGAADTGVGDAGATDTGASDVGAGDASASDAGVGAGDAGAGDDVGSTARESLARMLGVPVRVWAELGRTTVPLGQALELPPGTVLELDQAAEAPIELFVNGLCFAHGSLEVTAEGAWAVQIDALV
ncbi:MAG TPA: FliM/FliN family flagellar motor switch protein [Solirubrobacteraceae bacterium]|jgi:flagellar motor switch protein FliM|nr:FliM/FliN family flagellar motor switch protein [Solirubrobacteraceae bacterium]